MRPTLPSTIAAGLALLSTASAFSDTSPYIISHPSESISLETTSATTTTTLLPLLRSLTSACSADTYLLITLPRTHSSDLHHYPRLHSSLPKNPNTLQLPFVVPSPDISATDLLQAVAETAKSQCGAVIEETVDMAAGAHGEKYDGVTPRVMKVLFESPKTAMERDTGVEDRFLEDLLKGLPTKKTMVVIATTPVFQGEKQSHGVPKEVKHGSGRENVDMEIMPDLRRREREGGDDEDAGEKGSLFERYQFFTPALFMGYIVLFVILGIGYVGISALSGLKVSYGAFEKEMGPNAQKKVQ